MRTVRLLPVVVAAAGALLALKTVGLVTDGGYVLTGVGTASAQDAGVLPADAAPARNTLAEEHARAPGTPEVLRVEDVVDLAPEVVDFTRARTWDDPDCTGAGDDATAAAAGDEELRNFGFVLRGENCLPLGDAMPTQLDASGRPVPLATDAAGVLTEQLLLERLTERREALEAYAAELEMREALLSAAERRLEERAAAMAALEAQIGALVAEHETAEGSLVASVVTIYETMRPRDAANIFNELDMDVLIEVARGIAPRKMAPILAAMNPVRAQQLTVRLADLKPVPADQLTTADRDALPQIFGQ